MHAWERVSSNAGGRTPGIDRVTTFQVKTRIGVEAFLERIRTSLKSGEFEPAEVRQVMIPKAGGKLRRLGIPTIADRVVQASLKAVLEPLFEADFKPSSYGFRPNRRAHDAVAEIHHLSSGSNKYHWVLEADIHACFDEIDHTALMTRLRARISDRRVNALVKAFLKSGVMTTIGDWEATPAGTPQGGVLSPLLANLALSALDEHFDRQWHQEMRTDKRRARRRRNGLGNWRLIRYADDFVVVVSDEPPPCRGPARGGDGRARPSGAAAVTGQDPRRPYRRGLRLPRLSHQEATQARNAEVAIAAPRFRRRGHRNRQSPPLAVDHRARHVESPVQGDMHAGFGGRVRETD